MSLLPYLPKILFAVLSLPGLTMLGPPALLYLVQLWQ